jgi:hypothetical protein
MPYKTPRAMPKSNLKRDMAILDSGYSDQTKTLTQFFTKHVANAWDLDRLKAAELVTIRENRALKDLACLIMLEITPD